MGWVYGVRIWQGWGRGHLGGDRPSAAVGGAEFFIQLPTTGRLLQRGLCDTIADRIPDTLTSLLRAPRSQLPPPAVPAQSTMSSFPSGGEAAQGEGRAWQHQCDITGMSEDRAREHGEHGREWRAHLRET